MTRYAQDKRVWLAGGALVAVLIALVAWTGFIGPQRHQTDSLHSQVSDVEFGNTVLAGKGATLRRESLKLASLQGNLRTALDALPSDAALPTFTRSVISTATRTGVNLTGITVANSTPVVSATPAAAPAPTPSSTPSSTPSGSTASTSTAAAPTVAAPVASQFSSAVTVSIKGGVAASSRFVHDLQYGRRSALVTSVQVTGQDGTPGGVTTVVQLQIFNAPRTPADVAAMQKLLSAKH